MSPPGSASVRFVAGRVVGADVRLGADAPGSAAVAVAGGAGSLVGVARRPGIVTVEDVVATVLRRLGIDAGDALRTVAPVDRVALRERLERDDGVGVGLSIATVTVAFTLIVLGALARVLGMQAVAARLGIAVLLAPFAYLLGLFIPSGSWAVRAIPVFAVPVAALWPRPSASRAALLAGVFAAIVAVLTIAAAARPSGEPALSLWGNPFSSWRFFGLRNHLAGFLAGGVITWAGLTRPRPRALAAAGVAAAVVVGAPRLGANFGGVLTLVFGLALAYLLARDGRPSVRAVALAGLVAVAAMALALFSDTGTPVSHGGRAVRSVSDDGLGALADILRNRARLNWREVTDRGALGYAGAVVVAGALVALAGWGARRLRSPHGVVVAAGAGAALLAVITEDSGFMTGGVIGLYPAAAWVLASRGAPVDAPASVGASAP